MATKQTVDRAEALRQQAQLDTALAELAVARATISRLVTIRVIAASLVRQAEPLAADTWAVPDAVLRRLKEVLK